MNNVNPPTLLPDQPLNTKQKYTLSKTVLIVWFVFFAITIWLGVSHNLDARAQGQLTGRFMAGTLFALLLSWIAWRLSRRSAWVKSTVFLIVFLAFTLDMFAGLSARNRQARSPALDNLEDQVRQVRQAQIDQFNETGELSVDKKGTDQVIAALQQAADNGTDLERKFMTSTIEFVQQLKQAEEKHSAAAEQMNSDWILEPTTPKSIQEIDALANSTTNFLQANQSFLHLFTNRLVTLAGDLKARGVPARAIEGAIDGFKAGFDREVPFITKIRQQDADLGDALLGILHLYKTEHGKWKWDSTAELVDFDNPSSDDRWLELVQKIVQSAEDQQQTQSDLMSLRSKNLSPPKWQSRAAP